MTPSHHVRVLLVEDEPTVRLVACDSLEEAGFDVIEADNAQAALNVLNARPDDVGVLFTDVNMPGALDGMDLAELVHRRWPRIKLVLTSGRAPMRAMPDHGRFLAKPYDLGRMTDLIARVSAPGF